MGTPSEESNLLLYVDPQPRRPSKGRRPHRSAAATQRTVAVLLSIAALIFILATYAWLPHTLNTEETFAGADAESHASNGGVDPSRVFQNILSAKRLRHNLEYYASGTHVAGANMSQTEYTSNYFALQGLDTEIVEYYPWLNRPVGQRVALFDQRTNAVMYEAGLGEDSIPGDHATEDPNNPPAFHSHSAHGNVTGQLVYANYGTAEDIDALTKVGVSLQDKIVLVRHGRTHSSTKLLAAELAGARGMLVYSDPADDGYARGRVYPEGPWRPESSVQRDSVLRSSIYPGDPLTPGYASTRDAQRLLPAEATNLNRIPSLPLSYRDAQPLLNALQGHGTNAADIDRDWVGGLTSRGVRYWTGPSTLLVNLANSVEYKIAPIQNVIGRIRGRETPEEIVIIGNHRDSWSAGASDSSSGSAVLLELARAFGELQKLGWRPRRTIVLASWDAGEYGYVGSTEWVEENIDWLRSDAIAYVNVGTAVAGKVFEAAASPAMKGLLYSVAAQVRQPHSNGTVYEAWLRYSMDQEGDSPASDRTRGHMPKPRVHLPSLASDSVAFIAHAGISVVDLGFTGSTGAHHSSFDSLKRMLGYIDPDMQLHRAAAELWGLLALRLADDPILGHCTRCYAKDLKHYIGQLEKQVAQCWVNTTTPMKFRRLRAAQRQLLSSARIIEHDIKHLRSVYGDDCQMAGRRRHARCLALRASINDRISRLEQHFLDPAGIPHQRWYKHVLFGPEVPVRPPGTQLFPMLAEPLESCNVPRLRQLEKSVADILLEAAWFLREV
ncbi:Vacuolar protein sorting-associated protein 70 [Coemansia guatemalensis]|uniref:Vacuolar protein sorting-associated protein 70 n=1 Tax=Coemansia guatemalensis TaxID=2761395 RepID=A0A9W8LU26_9FUNG|nr:Vacuolar protein sorting-associated protein 70 [Coemansia guatemalensis]